MSLRRILKKTAGGMNRETIGDGLLTILGTHRCAASLCRLATQQ